MSNKENQVSKTTLYLIMTGMLVTGTCNTLVTKVQDETHGLGQLFTHPYLQAAVMFLGELMCLPAYGVKTLLANRKADKADTAAGIMLSPGGRQAKKLDMPTNINPLLIAIPASCDFCGSSLMFVALTMVPASVYQMMRGIIVVITALFSVCFLGRKQYRHHWVAIIFIVSGVAEVGVVTIASGTAS